MNAIAVPVEQVLLLAFVLFALGLFGVLARRNALFMLMSLEVMMNSTALAFVAGGARWGVADGQVMFLLVLTLAAAEVAVGLGLLLQLARRFGDIDIDAAGDLHG